MNNKSLIISIVIIVVLAAIGFYLLKTPATTIPENPDVLGDATVTNFRDCADAGYPVTESLPRQCRTPDGKIFTEGVDNPTAAKATGGCYIGGCSAEVCSDQPNTASNCIYKEEFMCYKTSVCEPAASGQCGWRQDSILVSCVAAARQDK